MIIHRQTLISTKGYWIDHVHQVKLTTNKLKEFILKYDIETFLFGQTEMEYLGFWVTHDGVNYTKNNELMKNMMQPAS